MLVFATAGGVLLTVSSEPFDGSWPRGRRQHLADTSLDQDAGVVGAVTGGSGTGGFHTARGVQEQGWEESWRNDTRVSLSPHCSSKSKLQLPYIRKPVGKMQEMVTLREL